MRIVPKATQFEFTIPIQLENIQTVHFNGIVIVNNQFYVVFAIVNSTEGFHCDSTSSVLEQL